MKKRLEAQNNLFIRQEIIDGLTVEGNKITGVVAQNGIYYRARAVILTTGPFLKGLIHVGGFLTPGGRMGSFLPKNCRTPCAHWVSRLDALRRARLRA